MSKHLVSKSILALTLALFALNGQAAQTEEYRQSVLPQRIARWLQN